MKKDDDKDKVILDEKNTLNDIVQVDFSKNGAEAKNELKNAAGKVIGKDSSKQELLDEIERLNEIVKTKDAEIKRMKDGFGELLDIEEKRDESIALHKRAITALNSALKEAENIVGNAKKVADKIIKNAGDSLERGYEEFDSADYGVDDFSASAASFSQEPRRSVAEETIQELRRIKGSDDYKDDSLESTEESLWNSDEIIKLPGADKLSVGKELLTAGTADSSALLGAGKEDEKETGADIKVDGEKESRADSGDKEKDEKKEKKEDKPKEAEDKKKKPGFFSRFSRKK